MLLYILLYTLLWWLLLALSSLSSSKYLSLVSQRNNFITALHALIVPGLCLGYALSLSEPLNYNRLMGPVMKHLLALSAGFMLFSLVNLFRAERKPELAMLVHHVIVFGFFVYMIYIPDLPLGYGYILIPQCTAAVYHGHLIFKEADSNSVIGKQLYELNFYTWVFFRFGVEGALAAIMLFNEFTLYYLTTSTRVMICIGLVFSYYFNLHWLVILMRKRKEKKTARLQATNLASLRS